MRGSLQQPFISLLFLICASVAVLAQTPQYTIRDLGAFSARAVNNSSKVVGSMGNKAVVYENGVVKDITPPGVSIAVATGINNVDQIVGHGFICDLIDGNCVNGRTRAFIYHKGTVNVLGTLGGRDSLALAINDSGQVTGWSDAASSPQLSGPQHAFIFKNGVFEDIGSKTTATNTNGAGINAAGEVTGYGSSTDSNRGAFIYNNGGFVFFETRGVANDVNDSGQVVGRFGGNDDGSGRAFLYSAGTFQDLGTLSAQHTFSHARAINNAGQIVGISSPTFFSSDGQRAFLYANGTMQDLNTLIAANSGWTLTSADDVNDAGQIVGNGLFNGESHAYLLTPMQPLLLTEFVGGKAIAVQSVMLLRDPFTVTTSRNLSLDVRTRLTILLRNMETLPGETIAPPTVQIENAAHQLISLPVEFVGNVPGFSWLTQIVVRLPAELDGVGSVQLFVSFRGRDSNKGLIQINSLTTP